MDTTGLVKCFAISIVLDVVFVEYRESDRDIHVINTDKQEKCEHKKTKRGIFPLVGEALQCQDCWKFIKIW